jgi:hypothetical protein
VRQTLLIIALLLFPGAFLAGCASEWAPETSLHVAIERDARREGFRRVAVITDDFYWCYPLTHEVIRVPKGFETDFASIPYAAAGIIDPMGDNMEGAVIHDYLYAIGEPGQREKADTILLDALEQHHVDPVRRKIMYETVRLGGAKNYGAITEWRFADPETQKPVKAPPRPKTAIIAQLKRCEDLKGATYLKMSALRNLPLF